jgi:hypothetical protein
MVATDQTDCDYYAEWSRPNHCPTPNFPASSVTTLHNRGCGIIRDKLDRRGDPPGGAYIGEY